MGLRESIAIALSKDGTKVKKDLTKYHLMPLYGEETNDPRLIL